jgi:hypothetical protein
MGVACTEEDVAVGAEIVSPAARDCEVQAELRAYFLHGNVREGIEAF